MLGARDTRGQPRERDPAGVWKALKALGTKHVGPKIGTVRINQQDMLAHVFARGPWHSTPDDHLVFTFSGGSADRTGAQEDEVSEG